MPTIRYASWNLTPRFVPRKKSAWNWPWYQTTAWPAVAPNSASRISFALARLPKLSRHGELLDLPWSLSRAKSGVSWSRSRMYSARTTRIADRRNGIRQPNAAKSSACIDVRVTKTTIRASRSPSVAVVWIQLVLRPRSLSGLCSAT